MSKAFKTVRLLHLHCTQGTIEVFIIKNSTIFAALLVTPYHACFALYPILAKLYILVTSLDDSAFVACNLRHRLDSVLTYFFWRWRYNHGMQYFSLPLGVNAARHRASKNRNIISKRVRTGWQVDFSNNRSFSGLSWQSAIVEVISMANASVSVRDCIWNFR